MLLKMGFLLLAKHRLDLWIFSHIKWGFDVESQKYISIDFFFTVDSGPVGVGGSMTLIFLPYVSGPAHSVYNVVWVKFDWMSCIDLWPLRFLNGCHQWMAVLMFWVMHCGSQWRTVRHGRLWKMPRHAVTRCRGLRVGRWWRLRPVWSEASSQIQRAWHWMWALAWRGNHSTTSHASSAGRLVVISLLFYLLLSADQLSSPPYSSRTLLVGVGSPPVDSFSPLVVAIMAVGLGIPMIILLVGGIWLCIRKSKGASSASYEPIN